MSENPISATSAMRFGNKTIACPLASASLTTRFAVYSFFCIGVMTVALWFLVSNYLSNHILEREWEITARMIRADVAQLLEDYDFRAADRNSVGHKFEALLKHVILIPDFIRFKVYSPKGVIIWSDDKRLVGQSFPDNEQLKEAIAGKVVADMSLLNKDENIYDQNHSSSAIEVYVPIYSEKGRELLGVIETYRRPDVIFRAIREARLVVLLGALGGGLLLYMSLFAIVRQAAKKINEQQVNLLKMQSELAVSQRLAAVGEIAAAVAHGIGNPLSSIRAAAQVAKLDCNEREVRILQEKTLNTLERIIQQVDRVQKRMQGLLNFAKPMEPRPGPVEINSLLRDIIEVLRPRFIEAAVSPRLDFDKELLRAQLDVNQVEQVFMGLITNALEATPRGGSVTVRTESCSGNGTPASIHVTIEDTGEGIPVEIRQRVFEPFFTTKSHGTGIGLALARKFVERNGGKIVISDAQVGGAKFVVMFPLGRSS